MFEPVIQLALQFGHPAVQDEGELRAGRLPLEEVALALYGLCLLFGTGQDAGQRAGQEIAAHLKAGYESGPARQEDDQDRGLSAKMRQDGPRRRRACGAVGIDQGAGCRGHLAEVFLLDSQSHDPVSNISFLAERHPELLPVVGRSLRPHKVINDAGLADAAHLDDFVMDKVLDLAFRPRGQFDGLGDRQVLGQDQGQRRPAPICQARLQMGLGFIR